MLSYSKRLLFSILILLSTVSFSQSKKALQDKKEQIEKDIKYTNRLLQKTKKNKEKSLSYLNALNRQVENREELLETLSLEIRLIEKQIRKTTTQIQQKETSIKEKKDEVKTLEEDYAKMIYYASKNQTVYDSWVFIFSSESFSQAYKRIKYLKQYTQHRKNQVQIISKSKQELTNEIVNLDNHKRNLATEKGNKKKSYF